MFNKVYVFFYAPIKEDYNFQSRKSIKTTEKQELI